MEFLDLIVSDRDAAYDAASLTPQERALADNTDWLGLVQYGVCFFVRERFARVVKITNLGMYASMRSETLEAFLKTRRVPDAVRFRGPARHPTRAGGFAQVNGMNSADGASSGQTQAVARVGLHTHF